MGLRQLGNRCPGSFRCSPYLLGSYLASSFGLRGLPWLTDRGGPVNRWPAAPGPAAPGLDGVDGAVRRPSLKRGHPADLPIMVAVWLWPLGFDPTWASWFFPCH